MTGTGSDIATSGETNKSEEAVENEAVELAAEDEAEALEDVEEAATEVDG